MAAGPIAAQEERDGRTNERTSDRRADRAGRQGKGKGREPPPVSTFPVTNPPIESRGGGGGGEEFPAGRG